MRGGRSGTTPAPAQPVPKSLPTVVDGVRPWYPEPRGAAGDRPLRPTSPVGPTWRETTNPTSSCVPFAGSMATTRRARPRNAGAVAATYHAIVPSKESVRALIERYAAAMNRRDRTAWLDCFANDAVQEDPVGTPPNVGREAIGRFFDANQIPVTLSVLADPLVIGNEVMAFFDVVAEIDGNRMRLPRIVDHIVLTPDGTRFQTLRAFFDYAEMVPADGSS